MECVSCLTVRRQNVSMNELEKCMLDNPDLPVEFVKELLETKNQGSSLAEPFEAEEDKAG